jgi:mercuric ion binding protein
MKTIKMFFAVAILLVTVSFADAQSDKTQRTIGIKTQTIHVSGTCSMDKSRIETAAYAVDGIKLAVWDEDTQVLTIKYSVFKKDASDIAQKKIALAGNDTGKYRADDMAYQNLPDCCRYKRHQS